MHIGTWRLARIIGVLALGAVLFACSAIKLGYNNINEVAYWWLDGYLDFTDTQTPRVREDLARLHQWHRSNELPRYADLLQKIEKLAPGEITAAQACGVFADIRQRLDAIGERAEPAVVTVAISLTPEQLKTLERKYASNDADYRKDWLKLTPAEQKEKRFKQVLERSEDIYGKLDEAQRAVMRKQLDLSSFDAQRYFTDRQRRQQDALATLRKVTAKSTTLDEARALMRGYFDRSQASPDAAYRAYQEAAIQEGCRSFAATHNSTTPAQRAAAVEKLRGYQRDVRELIAQQ